MSRSSLLRLDALARHYGGRPSAYAAIDDPLAAFWLDEAAHMVAMDEEAKRAPKPPSTLDKLFGVGKR